MPLLVFQEKAIPYLMGEHSDFVGLAQTGTGKTAGLIRIFLNVCPTLGNFSGSL